MRYWPVTDSPPRVVDLQAYKVGPDLLELNERLLADALGFLVLHRHIGR